MNQVDLETVGMLFRMLKERAAKVYFTLVKLPLMLFAIVAGFIFEFILELPFIVLIFMGYRSKNQKKYVDPGDGRQMILHKK